MSENTNTPPGAEPRTDHEPRPGFVQTWLVACRPFALPASTMPVVFGTVMAITTGQAAFNLPLFLAAFFGMALLHTGANLLNDVYDYRKGIDQRVNPVSGAVVRRWISTREALVAACLFMTAGSVLGLYIYSQVGTPILLIGIVGVMIGVLYSWGPFGLKYNALGDLAVFINFGTLGALGAWTVQTHTVSWLPVLWAIPMSLLVSGILHANNWRDIMPDSAGGIHTMAELFGDRRSIYYYAFLLFGPYAVILGLVILAFFADTGSHMPLTFLITFLALPLSIKLMKKGLQRHTATDPLDFLALDGATAQLNLLFGILCTAALGLDVLITHFVL